MRDEFSKHRCPGQERHCLLKAAETTVSRSFLCLVFVVSRSVMPAELSCVICSGIVLLPHVYVTCMCVYVNVVACLKILLELLLLLSPSLFLSSLLLLLLFIVIIIIIIYYYYYCYYLLLLFIIMIIINYYYLYYYY